MSESPLPDLAATRPLCRATVAGIGAAGTVLVQFEESPENLACDLLVSSKSAPLLAVGDAVLVCLLSPQRGLVLGRIGPSHSAEIDAEGTPDHLLLEAHKTLTLQCGDGSITIRKDGKILIKGKNLVSLALETNRIKGGSVSIN